MKSSLYLTAAIMLLPSMILGQQFSLSDLPQKDITFDCQVEPTPEFGKEFTVTITFSLNEETRYVDNPRAGAEARIGMFPRQQFISGDTLITGRLSVGEMYTMTATYRAINRGEMHIGLNLKIRGEADSTGKEKLHGYTVTRRRCGFYRIESDAPVVRETILDSTTGLKIQLLPPGDPTVPKPKVPWLVSPPDEKPDKTPEELKIKKRTEKGKQQETVSSASTFATSETKYLEFEADTKVEIIGEPKPGDPFEVVFTFAPLEDLLHNRGVPDKAYLTSERGVRFLGGDTVWSGFMQKGQEYSLRAQYVADSGVAFRFRGIVYAMEVPGRIPPPDPVRDSVKQVGTKCVNGAVSRLIDFRPDKQKRPQQKIPRLMMTDTGLVPIGIAMVAPPSVKVRKPLDSAETQKK